MGIRGNVLFIWNCLVLMFYCSNAWEHAVVFSMERFQTKSSIMCTMTVKRSYSEIHSSLYYFWSSHLLDLQESSQFVFMTTYIQTLVFEESYQFMPIQFIPKFIYLDKILNDKKEALPLSRFLKYGFLRNDLHWGYILFIQRAESLINYIQCRTWKIHRR